ncbi:MAG: alpha/beta hydrolase [Magnetococcales bacterium]|nr:alpha/beta hydrolase [Magnetococcales bacterium]
MPVLNACVGPWLSPTERAKALATEHGLRLVRLQTSPFLLTGFVRHSDSKDETMVVYIEGDGLAWLNRTTLSPDPTPRDLLVLQLLLQDPTPKALYLGRPCQYIGGIHSGCNPDYWSTHRYAKEVVLSIDQAIDTVKQQLKAKRVGLVGYSGGGVIAAVLAARRTDISWLITVAANLDLTAWTHYHHVTPMIDSLNPVDFISRLQHLPQTHFIGGQDQQVPEVVIRSFLNHLPTFTPVTVRVIPNFNHSCCWAEQWSDLLAEIPFRK